MYIFTIRAIIVQSTITPQIMWLCNTLILCFHKIFCLIIVFKSGLCFCMLAAKIFCQKKKTGPKITETIASHWVWLVNLVTNARETYWGKHFHKEFPIILCFIYKYRSEIWLLLLTLLTWPILSYMSLKFDCYC